jgi:hypothetical protein
VAAVLSRGPDVAVLGLIPVVIAVALGTVSPTLLVVQAAFSVIALLVGSSTSTKTMMDRLSEAQDQQSALGAGAGKR